MARHIRLRELLVAIEGLALFRRLFEADDERVQARIDEVRDILSDPDHATYGAGIDVPELDPRPGYAAWSEVYDHPGNPLISAEEPAVRTLVDGLAPGRALDAACGTGRHAGYLAERGHEVVGVDGSPEMLARAVARVPTAGFLLGDLERLPVADSAFDVVVCALSLGHLAALRAAIGELGRVARRGGRVIVTDLHPVARLTGGQAFFNTGDGAAGFVREYPHVHGDYLRAFGPAGLEVRDCLEPRMGEQEIGMQVLANAFVPEAVRDAYLGVPGALVWDLVRR